MIQTNTLKVSGQFLSEFTRELLTTDTADCVQIETHDGFLVKVLPPEQDLRSCPVDLQELMDVARLEGRDWIFIDHSPPGPGWEYRHTQ